MMKVPNYLLSTSKKSSLDSATAENPLNKEHLAMLEGDLLVIQLGRQLAIRSGENGPPGKRETTV